MTPIVTPTLSENQNTSVFVSSWLQNLDSDDGFIRTLWATNNGPYVLTGSPMLLNAIVNRVDLRNPSNNSVGELRFIFGHPFPTATNGAQGSVIVELVVPQSAQYSIQGWAQAWHALGDPNLGLETYNVMLQKLTDYALTQVGVHYRVRTANESPVSNWTFRQFEPDPNGYLVPANLTFTPGHQFDLLSAQEQNQLASETAGGFPEYTVDPNDEAVLLAYTSSTSAQIPEGLYTIPDTYKGRPMATKTFTMLQLYRGEENPLADFPFDESWDGSQSRFPNQCYFFKQHLQWLSCYIDTSRSSIE